MFTRIAFCLVGWYEGISVMQSTLETYYTLCHLFTGATGVLTQLGMF